MYLQVNIKYTFYFNVTYRFIMPGVLYLYLYEYIQVIRTLFFPKRSFFVRIFQKKDFPNISIACVTYDCVLIFLKKYNHKNKMLF